MMKVRKAVIPVAGYGTRFLPYTKAVPKAMLPILNKPAIQVISEEVVKSGITDILFVVGYRSEVLEAHFTKSNRLDEALLANKKFGLYEAVKYPETMARMSFMEQKALNGTAKAIEIAENFVNNEPFAILFGDDVMYNEGTPVIGQLIESFEKTGKSVVGCKEVALEDVPKYASVEYSEKLGNLYKVSGIVEKPPIEKVKSRISPLGRYVVTSKIFDIIKTLTPTVNNEYQLTDALDKLAKIEGLNALIFDGKRYDMGNRLGYLKANIEFGLRDEELAAPLKEYLKTLL